MSKNDGTSINVVMLYQQYKTTWYEKVNVCSKTDGQWA